ncbi:hypothetical protein [Parafrankia sp. CH37]|uniref:hypothetical protein n=1 Tax=Parafrankia sp. CH37 TaxID=683308 RepID=UPI0028A2243F|nr:hypothetical protein [Parafrankia sp. CH37]
MRPAAAHAGTPPEAAVEALVEGAVAATLDVGGGVSAGPDTAAEAPGEVGTEALALSVELPASPQPATDAAIDTASDSMATRRRRAGLPGGVRMQTCLPCLWTAESARDHPRPAVGA